MPYMDPTIPMYVGLFLKGALAAMISKAPENRPAEPKPAIALPTIKATEVGAAPQIALPTSNQNRAIMNTNFVENREYL